MIASLTLTLFFGIILCGCVGSLAQLLEWIICGTPPRTRGLIARSFEAGGLLALLFLGWCALHLEVLLT